VYSIIFFVRAVYICVCFWSVLLLTVVCVCVCDKTTTTIIIPYYDIARHKSERGEIGEEHNKCVSPTFSFWFCSGSEVSWTDSVRAF
jgi:hypothetical protein